MKSLLLILALLLVTLNGASSNAIHDVALSNKFVISVNFAAKKDASLESSSFIVLWNEVNVAEVYPEDYDVNNLQITVKAKVGENVINVAGTGKNQNSGVTIG
jgi:hypothetical protein